MVLAVEKMLLVVQLVFHMFEVLEEEEEEGEEVVVVDYIYQ